MAEGAETVKMLMTSLQSYTCRLVVPCKSAPYTPEARAPNVRSLRRDLS